MHLSSPSLASRSTRNQRSKGGLSALKALSVVVIVGLLSSAAAKADTAETTWLGTSGTLWSTTTGTTWGNGSTTGSGTSAVFNTTTTYAFQPGVISTGITTEGIWDTGASGGVTTTITGGAITITGNATLDGIANAGILLDGAGNNNLTIATTTAMLISNNTGFYVNNGGTLTISAGMNLNQKALTVGSTLASGSGAIIISGNWTGNGGSSITLNDTAGTTYLVLSGDDTYAGNTTATSGSIALTGTISTTVAGEAVVVNGANGVFNESSTGLLTGTEGVTVSAGLAVLNGANTNGGATTVSGGTLTLNGTLNYMASALGVTVSNNAFFNETSTGLLTGTGMTFTVSSGTATLNYANTYGGVTKNVGTLIVTNTGALGTNTTFAAVTLGGGTTRFLNDGTSNNGTIAFGGGYGYNGSGYNVDVIGASTIAVGQSTSATGNTVQFGTLDIGAIALTATNSNSYSLAFTGTNFSGGSSTFTNDMVSGTLSLATLTGTANAAQTETFNGVGSNAVTVVGAITQTSGSALNVTQSGAGDILVLNGSNTQTGVTTVSAGQLIATSTNAFGNNTAFNTVTVTTGTLRLLNDGTSSNGSIVYGNTANPTGYNVNVNGASAVINVDHLSTANTGNTIQLGTLDIGSSDVLTVTNGDGYNLLFSGTNFLSASSTFTNNMTSGTLTLPTLTGTATAGQTATFNGTSATAVTILGAISSGTTFNITQNGSDLLLLTGSDGASGTVTATSGTIRLSGAGTTAPNNSLSTGAAGVFDLNGINQSVGILSDNGAITNSNGTEVTISGTQNGATSGSYTGNLNVNLTNIGSNDTDSGSFTNSGYITINNPSSTGFTLSGWINNAGTLTNTGTAAVTISGSIGVNNTNIIQSSTGAALTVSLTALSNIVGGQTVTLTTNSVSGVNKQLNVTGTIGGQGTLVLDNNSSIIGGINVSSGTNTVGLTGNIINSGTGTGWTFISGGGSLALYSGTLIQNSATSPLAISFTGSPTDLGPNTLVQNGEFLVGYGGVYNNVIHQTETLIGGTITLGGSNSTNAVSLLSAGVAEFITITSSNNIVVAPGFLGTATIGQLALDGQVTKYTGNVNYTGVSNLILQPYGVGAGTAGMTLSGTLLGGTNLTILGISPDNSSSGSTWGVNYSTVSLSNTTNTISGQTSILSGNLALNSAATGSGVDGDLGTSGTATTPILIGATSGSNQAGLIIGNVTSTETLNRSIVINAGNAGETGLGAFTSTYNGAITLYKSLLLGYTSHGSDSLNGALTMAPSAIGAVSLDFGQDNNSGNVSLNNHANSYNGGTLLVSQLALLTTSGTTVFGTGNVVASVGALRLTSTNNLSNQTVYVGPLGEISASSATVLTNTYLQRIVDPASSGVIGFNLTYSGTLNLATIGDGDMYFSAEGATETFSGASLGADADGNYRLGWGNTSTTLSNSVLVGSGTLIIGGPEGAINPTLLNNEYSFGEYLNTQGVVTLSSSNSYSGGTVVNPNSTLFGTAQLNSALSPFGSSTGPVTLHDSTLTLLNNGTNIASATVGNLSFDGNSTVSVNGILITATNGSVTSTTNTTLALGTITRNNNGNLIISPAGTASVTGTTPSTVTGALGTTVFVTSSGGNSLPTFSVDTNGNDTANVNMVAPWITDGTYGDFLTYGANGFTPISTAVNNLGVGLADSYVKTNGLTTFSNLSGPQTIAALSLSGSLTGVTALQNNGSPINLLITTGGLTTGGAFVLSSGVWVPEPITTGTNIGLTATNEFDIYTPGGLNVLGTLTATQGIVKGGIGMLLLSNTANSITGTITVNQGSVAPSTIPADQAPGLTPWGGSIYTDTPLSNANIYLNGGELTFGDGPFTNNTSTDFSEIFSASRTISIGPDGGVIAGNVNFTGNGFDDFQEIVVNSQLSGTGDYLDLGSYGFLGMNGGDGFVVLTNTSNNFSAPLNVIGATVLVISDPNELGGANASTNAITFYGGNAGLQYGNAGTTGTTYAVATASGTISNPITFTDGGGEVDVVSSAPGAGATVLTLTAPVNGDGSVYKNGYGTLVLTGTGSTFQGSWVVNAGILSIDDPTQLGLSTAVVSGTDLGLNGISGNAAYIEPNGELAIAGSIALGGTGGKTLYVSGTGAGDGGALVNVSGSNSDAGQTVLQANTTVYAAASSSYTFGGAISDGSNGIGTLGYGLTVAGPGAVITTASNTYTGATTVAGGATFQVGNGGTTGALAPAGTIVDNGSLVFSRSNNVTQGTDFSSTSISGTGSLTQAGSRTLTLNVANSFSGATNVLSGTLNAAATGAVGSTTAINVSSGGTFLAGAANVASSAANVTLNGGTLKGGSGFNQGTGATVTTGVTAGSSTQGFGNLTLTTNSTLDFNDQSTIVFGAFNNSGNTLNVVNYVNNDFNTTTDTSGIDGTDDRLIFDNGTALSAGQLADINFGNVGLHYQIALGNGFYEVSAVPEPTTIFAGFLLIGLLGARERRRLSALYRQVAGKRSA